MRCCNWFIGPAWLQVPMYLEDGSPSPAMPMAGQDFMPLQKGDVVDVILQNLPANANGALP